MSEFVNYKKRDITLPKGCKDLHDVLRHQEDQKNQQFTPSSRPYKLKRPELGTRTLSEIGKYVATAFESRGFIFLAVVNPDNDRFTLNMTRDGGILLASAMVPDDPGHVCAMTVFFARRGLDMPNHSWLLSMFPSLPVHLIFNISPMPSQATLLSELIKDLFREVWGAKEDTRLGFQYFESDDI